jgi:hypothetical protein
MSCHSNFIHGEILPDTHWMGDWVDLGNGLDVVEKRNI